MKKLHDKCKGRIQVFKPKNYGLCEDCGTEGTFRTIKTKSNIKYVEFTEITIVRK